MTIKQKQSSKTEPAKVNKARLMELRCREGLTDGQTLAEAALGPEVASVATAVDYSQGLFPDICLQDCIEVMRTDIEAVNGGNLDRLEGMLTAQAGALNAMFNNFSKRAIHADVIPQLETYFRLALKAQAQCRATVEAIAEIKYPKSATFIRQANIAQQQQVNNGGKDDSRNASRAHAHERNITPSTELLEASHGERLDTGTTGSASGAYSGMATVGALNRAQDGSREGGK